MFQNTLLFRGLFMFRFDLVVRWSSGLRAAGSGFESVLSSEESAEMIRSFGSFTFRPHVDSLDL